MGVDRAAVNNNKLTRRHSLGIPTSTSNSRPQRDVETSSLVR